jgi:hypothetical protein
VILGLENSAGFADGQRVFGKWVAIREQNTRKLLEWSAFTGKPAALGPGNALCRIL